jgi:KaiC/GvpD/RAD55 family RecA-like ATPase
MIVPRVPSGIPGLDSLIEGGIPTNTTIALRAEPSNHVEYFLQQFISEGLKMGSPAVYCCLTRPPATLIRGLGLQGVDVLEYMANDQLVIIDCYSMDAKTSVLGVDSKVQKKIITVTKIDDERLLQNGLATAVERISNLRGMRAVCESLPSTLTGKSAIDLMRWGRRAFGDLRLFDTVTVHTFPKGVREELFNLMAQDFDSIMEIGNETTSDKTRFSLHVQKMRMTELPLKVLELKIDGAILSVVTIQKIG